VDQGPAESFADASGTMNMALATRGAHSVTVSVQDRAGNAFSIPIPFHYDTSAPDLEITSPAPNSWLNTAGVNVAWALSDPAGIANLQLSVDSSPAVVLSSATTAYGLPGLGESGHVVSLLALDSAGNIASQTVAFGVDTTPPSVTVVTPVSGTYSNAHQIQAVWMGMDTGSGIDRYEVSLDSAAAIPLTNSAGYVFPDVIQGAHTIVVTAVDRAGNTAHSTSGVTVDTTPPFVALTAPGSGATVYGSVSVNWTASDSGSGIARVVLLTDGAAQEQSAAQVTAPVPAPLSVGPHAVSVQVWDKAGNMAQATVAFTYGGATPPGPGGSNLPALDFWLIMILIGAVAVGSAYYAVRRRRKARS